VGVRFTKGQKAFIGFWIVLGGFWIFDIIAWRNDSWTAWLGILTAALGILTQIQLARRNTTEPAPIPMSS